MSKAKKIAEVLGDFKVSGDGFVCRCPNHDDQKASLSIKDDGAGGVILNCFGPCEWKDVKDKLKAMNLLEDFKPTKKEEKPTTRKPSPPAEYKYFNLDGSYAFSKIRTANKEFRFQPSGVKTKPLYNIRAVVEAKNNSTIYITEGEKDADALIGLGLIAVTNSAGASSWEKHQTELFSGHKVIICEDNDEAGQKRTQMLQREMSGVANSIKVFHFRDQDKEKGYDVSDWLEEGGKAEDIEKLAVAAPRAAAKEKEKKKSKSKSKDPAAAEDYYSIFANSLGELRRDIFSGDLMYKEETLWKPAANQLPVLRANVRDAAITSDLGWSINAVTDYFYKYESLQPKQLLIDIPAWDGQDRVKDACSWIDCGNVSKEQFEDLVKEWLSLTLERLHSVEGFLAPQNKILLLQGNQGAGKDTWLDMLLGGFGQHIKRLGSISGSKQTDAELLPSKALIINIDEFDKTARTEVAFLKSLITSPNSSIRASYDRSHEDRINRASFVATCNIEDILRDSTGNRRYLIFEVEGIKWAYKDWTLEQIKAWRSQIVAQIKSLSESKYRASKDSVKTMTEYIEDATPEDIGLLIKRTFFRKIHDNYNRLPESVIRTIEMSGFVYQTDADEMLQQVVKEFGGKMSIGNIKAKLRAKGNKCESKRDGIRVYLVPSDIGETTWKFESVESNSDLPF